VPGFAGQDYYLKEYTSKLNVIELDAYIFYYSFVKPPELMQKKIKSHNTNYTYETSSEQMFKNDGELFDYGDLSKIKVYKESHPTVMQNFIKKFN
jgi:hypothetical protein